MTTRLTILSYHNVEGTWAFPSRPGAGIRGFTAQLDWLGRRMQVVPLNEALRRLYAGEPLPRRAVAITFDDGYRDNLELAVAQLRMRGMAATFFLVPGLIDRTARPWWEVSAWALRESRREHLDWGGRRYPLTTPATRGVAARAVARSLKRVDRASREQAVAELVARLQPGREPDFGGLYVDAAGARALANLGFEIGSHSSWHAILANETPEHQAADLAGARRRLEEIAGAAVPLLAYPNGTSADYSDATIAAARTAGHSHALTTRRGTNTAQTPVFELRRFVVSPDRGASPLLWGQALGARAMRTGRRKLGGRG